VGAPAPAYAAVTPAGDPVSLGAARRALPAGGGAVLLNVWATWCQPCRAEVPALDTLQRRHAARGLRVVGVSVDDGRAPADVERFARRLGASYAVWLDPDDRISPLLGAYGVPASVLVDRAGVVRWRHVGPVTAADPGLARALDQVLAPPPDAGPRAR
jgi:thiol-disulfide isomerase/thioredoxin